MNTTPFRITQEDLAGLDKKTRTGLQPLLDALNTSMQSIQNALTNIPAESVSEGSFTTEPTGAAYVALPSRLSGRPASVEVNWLRRADGTAVAMPWGMTWQPRSSGGPRLLFVGLDPATKYSYRVTVK